MLWESVLHHVDTKSRNWLNKLEGKALLTINRRTLEKMILYAKKIMILLEKQHNIRLKSVMVFEETKRTAKLRRQHDSKNHSY